MDFTYMTLYPTPCHHVWVRLLSAGGDMHFWDGYQVHCWNHPSEWFLHMGALWGWYQCRRRCIGRVVQHPNHWCWEVARKFTRVCCQPYCLKPNFKFRPGFKRDVLVNTSIGHYPHHILCSLYHVSLCYISTYRKCHIRLDTCTPCFCYAGNIGIITTKDMIYFIPLTAEQHWRSEQLVDPI